MGYAMAGNRSITGIQIGGVGGKLSADQLTGLLVKFALVAIGVEKILVMPGGAFQLDIVVLFVRAQQFDPHGIAGKLRPDLNGEIGAVSEPEVRFSPADSRILPGWRITDRHTVADPFHARFLKYYTMSGPICYGRNWGNFAIFIPLIKNFVKYI